MCREGLSTLPTRPPILRPFLSSAIHTTANKTTIDFVLIEFCGTSQIETIFCKK